MAAPEILLGMPYAYFFSDNAVFPAALGEINALIALGQAHGHSFVRLAQRHQPPLSGAPIGTPIFLCTRDGGVSAHASGTVGPLVNGPPPAIVQHIYGVAPGHFRQLNGLHALNPPLTAQQMGWTVAQEQTFLQGQAYCRQW